VSVYSPGSRVGDDQVAALAAAGDQVVELNLQDAGLGDSVAESLGKLTGLARLRLSRNEITDRGIAALARLPRLERLNVYANAGVTDASVDAFASIASLRQLDVWQTGLTAQGIARLQQRRPDLAVQAAAESVITDVLPPPAAPR
jgi:hypothetical protein